MECCICYFIFTIAPVLFVVSPSDNQGDDWFLRFLNIFNLIIQFLSYCLLIFQFIIIKSLLARNHVIVLTHVDMPVHPRIKLSLNLNKHIPTLQIMRITFE